MLAQAIKNVKYHHVPIGPGKSFFFDHVHIFWHEQVPFHQHVEWELSYIVTGSGRRMVGDSVETFSRGEIVFIPPNIPHCWSFDEFDHDKDGKIQNITICFPGSLLKSFSENFPELYKAVQHIDKYDKAVKFEGATLETLQKIFIKMPAETDVQRLATLTTLLGIIGESSETTVVGYKKKENKGALKMREIHRFILNNYQREISLDDVASHVGMNRSSLCVFFKRVQGKSLITYLNEFRIESSCLMLRETSNPIADICLSVGFNDIPYFNRIFKKMKGITPHAYRKENRRV